MSGAIDGTQRPVRVGISGSYGGLNLGDEASLCTGDGDVAALAGAPFGVGRDPDGLVQPMKLMFRVVVARGSYPVDIHNPEGKGTFLKRLPLGQAYDIPLRCLLPHGVDHLLVAGRCISGTHEAHSSYRVMLISMATGQAAGACAALSRWPRSSERCSGKAPTCGAWRGRLPLPTRSGESPLAAW